MPISIYFPKNNSDNFLFCVLAIMFKFSIHPGEGAANVGASFPLGTAFLGIPNEKSKVLLRKSTIPLL